jgi:hypothetical protein
MGKEYDAEAGNNEVLLPGNSHVSYTDTPRLRQNQHFELPTHWLGLFDSF